MKSTDRAHSGWWRPWKCLLRSLTAKNNGKVKKEEEGPSRAG